MDSAKGMEITPKNFYSYFKGRADRVAVYNPNTSKVISIEVKKGDWEIVDRVKSHLAGQSRLALYNHLKDNTCTWANVIFEEASKAPTAKHSLLFAQDCAVLGLTEVKREKTKVKGENFSCWMFFEKPISAKKIRHLIGLIFKRLDITKADILPTEDILTEGSFGAYSWLPYFGGSDKWIDPSGTARVDLGVKMGHTVFLEDNGEPQKAPFARIRKYTEEEIDNAIMYLTEYIPSDPTPGEGIQIQDIHLKKIAEKCEAVKRILEEIKEKKVLSDKIVELLAPMYMTWRKPEYFHKIVSGTQGYDKDFIDKKMASLPLRAFTPCSAFREAGYCPEGKECFPARPPIAERYGKLEEDRNAPKDRWRKFYPALWAFQGIRERLEDEASAETAIIDVDAIDLGEQLKSFGTGLAAKRDGLIKSRRSFSGLPTGFHGLNQSLNGLAPDTLTIVAGVQGIGKGTFCSQIMDNCAAEKNACVYITYGDTSEGAISRILSRCSGIDYRKIVRGMLGDDEMAKLRDMSARLQETYAPYIYVIEGNDGMGIRKIKSIIDALPVKLLIIDSLNMLPFISRQQITDIPSRFDQNVRQLKTLARYKQIPVVAAYSIRDKDSNIPEFIYAETLVMQSCDNWIHLEEGKALDQQTREYMMVIRKNRAGDRNIMYKLAFQPATQRFMEVK